MLYVSKYDKVQDKYGITDTDDGTTEFVSSGEAFDIVRNMHLRIKGVDINQMKIGVVRANSTPKSETATAGAMKSTGAAKATGTAKVGRAIKANKAKSVSTKKPAVRKATGTSKAGATKKPTSGKKAK